MEIPCIQHKAATNMIYSTDAASSNAFIKAKLPEAFANLKLRTANEVGDVLNALDTNTDKAALTTCNIPETNMVDLVTSIVTPLVTKLTNSALHELMGDAARKGEVEDLRRQIMLGTIGKFRYVTEPALCELMNEAVRKGELENLRREVAELRVDSAAIRRGEKENVQRVFEKLSTDLTCLASRVDDIVQGATDPGIVDIKERYPTELRPRIGLLSIEIKAMLNPIVPVPSRDHTGLEKRVLDYFREHGEETEAGCLIQDAFHYFRTRAMNTYDGQVEACVRKLEASGHIYSTIDDFHFKATDAHDQPEEVGMRTPPRPAMRERSWHELINDFPPSPPPPTPMLPPSIAEVCGSSRTRRQAEMKRLTFIEPKEEQDYDQSTEEEEEEAPTTEEEPQSDLEAARELWRNAADEEPWDPSSGRGKTRLEDTIRALYPSAHGPDARTARSYPYAKMEEVD